MGINLLILHYNLNLKPKLFLPVLHTTKYESVFRMDDSWIRFFDHGIRMYQSGTITTI